MYRQFIVLISVASFLLLSAPSLAEKGPDYGRRGWYAGVGAGAAIDFLEEWIEEAIPLADIKSTGSFNARGGYRVWSWFALEAMYEGTYRSNIEILDIEVAEFSTHSLLGNLKLLVPIKRFHPYFMLGLGAQYGSWDGLGIGFSDTNRWDMVVRPAVGLDVYLTENWLVDLELGIPVRIADWTNIPSQITDNVTITIGVGAQYRF